MISRIWHGWTVPENADSYEQLLREEIFVGILNRQIPGFQHIQLLRREIADQVEFVTIMRFDSMEAVRAFAGDDFEAAVVPAKARGLLTRFDARSQHYEISAQREAVTDGFLAPEIADLDLAGFMKEALKEAETAGEAGEFPIGAVIVIDGEIIARGQARHQMMRSQLRHAELNALLDGGERLWTEFQRAILFTTVEPCPLCLGAVVMADIPHIIFGLHDQNVCSAQTVTTNPYVHRHIKSYYGGVLAEESSAIFARYDSKGLNYMQTAGLL